MVKARSIKPKWMPYPEYQRMRTGIKVSWYYYKSREDAEKAAIAARHNAQIQMQLGYDFGYQSPGSIQNPNGFHPDLYEVCIP